MAKARQVISYVKSGVNFDNNMMRCQILVMTCWVLSFQIIVARGRGGVYEIFPCISIPLSLAAVVLVFVFTARPRTTFRRLILNLLLSATTLINLWLMSLMNWFMGFGVSAFSAIVFLPSIITAVLMPIMVQKDLEEKRSKKVLYGTIGSATGISVIVGVVMGRLGTIFGETMLKDMSQVQAHSFLLALYVALSCLFVIGTIGNSVKLYWLGRLKKRGYDIGSTEG